MITIQGNFNRAVCYCDELERTAAEQIQSVCDAAPFANCKIRIMPDVHAGMGCTIGTTMTITDKVVPGMVGVDIGCGMETVKIAQKDVDFGKLDALIRNGIPCGREIRRVPHPFHASIDLNELVCAPFVGLHRAAHSIGTLGGGNHFIEMDRGSNGAIYLVVHSGSRHLGLEVAKYYQNEGHKAMWGGADYQIKEIIAALKSEGRFSEIESTVIALKREHTTFLPRDLCYVDGKLFDDYIHDMKLVQRFAMLNRQAMTSIILDGMGWQAEEAFTTIHNYIDTGAMILRKGAVAAYAGEKLLIPINMRDGSLICTGKGNADWNCSAPHGAGRLMSRKEAFRALSLTEYRSEMEGIYSTCIAQDTLDESPMAYKSKDSIVSQIGPTVDIVDCIKPLYNFKASE